VEVTQHERLVRHVWSEIHEIELLGKLGERPGIVRIAPAHRQDAQRGGDVVAPARELAHLGEHQRGHGKERRHVDGGDATFGKHRHADAERQEGNEAGT
jgi:hypothetical protein